MTPAFTSSSLKAVICSSSSWLGISPASLRSFALIITMTRIAGSSLWSGSCSYLCVERASHGSTRPGWSLGFAPPEPAERVRQDGAAVVRVVAAVSDDETEVVPTLREGRSYSQVGAEPVVLGSSPVEIASRCLEEYPQRFLRRLLDQLGVTVAAPKLGEAPEEAQDAPEPIRPRPGGREGAASAATPAADR